MSLELFPRTPIISMCPAWHSREPGKCLSKQEGQQGLWLSKAVIPLVILTSLKNVSDTPCPLSHMLSVSEIVAYVHHMVMAFKVSKNRFPHTPLTSSFSPPCSY